MTLHFSHIGLTDGLTFIKLPPFLDGLAAAVRRLRHIHGQPLPFGIRRPLLGSPGDPALGEVVRRHLNCYLIARNDSDVVHSELTGNMSKDLVSVSQLHLKIRIGQSLYNCTFDFDNIFLRQANASSSGKIFLCVFAENFS